jgi:SOS-response transcriptional repressor LexA
VTVRERIAASDQRVLLAIALYWRQHGFSPSLRDICALAAVSSTSQAALHLERLRAAGMVEYEPGIARSIRLVKERQS